MICHYCDNCGAQIYFQNGRCVHCGSNLLFDHTEWRMVAATPQLGTDLWTRCQDGRTIKPCGWQQAGICNWACSSESDVLCISCQTTTVHPDPQDLEVRSQWAHAELAKRRLLFNLKHRGLPVWASDGIAPLQFQLLSPRQGEGWVSTGHQQGLITINLEEANPVHRIAEQTRFAEPLRTVLGHLRHESGHFYWHTLVEPHPDLLDTVRQHFGDDRLNYAEALVRHHQRTAAQSACQSPRIGFISSYAAVHPWEDWAETWSHYLLMLDALDIQHPGLWTEVLNGASPFNTVLDAWQDLTVQLNELNRAMGLPDPYPFVLDSQILDKLSCVHSVVRDAVLR